MAQQTSQIGQIFPIEVDSFKDYHVVSRWHDLNPNKREATKQRAKLLVICNTLRKTPDELMPLSADGVQDIFMETLTEFKKIVEAGNIQHTMKDKQVLIPSSYREYEACLKSFLSAKFYVPPQLKFVRNERPYHYPVLLNDDEITKVFHLLNEETDKRFLICATIQHEIFCRFESAFLKWEVNNIEIETGSVDGIVFRYVSLNGFYEPKQHEHFDKRIFDPRVFKIVNAIPKDKPFIPSPERREFTVKYNKLLRQIYASLGKIDLDIPPKLKTKEWYWYNRPSHCLRKSGSAQALRRCGYDYSNVSAMGWANDTLLRKTYAQPKIMLNKNCEYCKPPEIKQKNEEFCSFEHYLAYQYNGKQKKAQTDDITYLKARIRELEGKA